MPSHWFSQVSSETVSYSMHDLPISSPLPYKLISVFIKFKTQPTPRARLPPLPLFLHFTPAELRGISIFLPISSYFSLLSTASHYSLFRQSQPVFLSYSHPASPSIIPLPSIRAHNPHRFIHREKQIPIMTHICRFGFIHHDRCNHDTFCSDPFPDRFVR